MTTVARALTVICSAARGRLTDAVATTPAIQAVVVMARETAEAATYQRSPKRPRASLARRTSGASKEVDPRTTVSMVGSQNIAPADTCASRVNTQASNSVGVTSRISAKTVALHNPAETATMRARRDRSERPIARRPYAGTVVASANNGW